MTYIYQVTFYLLFLLIVSNSKLTASDNILDIEKRYRHKPYFFIRFEVLDKYSHLPIEAKLSLFQGTKKNSVICSKDGYAVICHNTSNPFQGKIEITSPGYHYYSSNFNTDRFLINVFANAFYFSNGKRTRNVWGRTDYDDYISALEKNEFEIINDQKRDLPGCYLITIELAPLTADKSVDKANIISNHNISLENNQFGNATTNRTIESKHPKGDLLERINSKLKSNLGSFPDTTLFFEKYDTKVAVGFSKSKTKYNRFYLEKISGVDYTSSNFIFEVFTHKVLHDEMNFVDLVKIDGKYYVCYFSIWTSAKTKDGEVVLLQINTGKVYTFNGFTYRDKEYGIVDRSDISIQLKKYMSNIYSEYSKKERIMNQYPN